MRKKSILVLAITLFSGYCIAQGGSVRVLPDFRAIVLNSTGNVVINQGDVYGVRLDGDENTKDKAIIEVRNGKLFIDRLMNKNTAYVTFVNLDMIDMSGTGNMKSEGVIKAEDLKIESSGTGRGEFTVEVKSITANLSGVGKITLSGTADNITGKISGTGSIQASKLVVSKAVANISGIGKMHIDVRDELVANISGNGSVQYVTPPNIINKDISGLGNVSDKSKVSDTTKILIGDKEIMIIDRDIDMDDNIEDQIKKRQNQNAVNPFWAGIELGVNGYLNADNETTLPLGSKFLELDEGKSIAFNINFLEYKIKLEKDHLWLVTGLGLGYNNYRFSNNQFQLKPGASVVSAITDTFNFDKSKLVVSYVTVPLLLQVNTSRSKRNNFHLSTGAIFAYKLGSHTKYVTKDGSRKKEKERDDFNLEPIRLDATVRLGYRNFNVFANYAVTELFKNGEGPELHPYTFGISLIGW